MVHVLHVPRALLACNGARAITGVVGPIRDVDIGPEMLVASMSTAQRPVNILHTSFVSSKSHF